MAWLDLTIATKADGPLKTVSDIVAAAKKDPGKLNFGTIAPGSTQHLSAELFRLTGDIKVTMVTFRTTPDLVTALLRGDVDVGFDYLAGFRAQMNDRIASGVASTGEKRVAVDARCADGPRKRHAGLCGDELERRLGAGRHARRHRPVPQQGNHEALKSPDIQAKALQFGLDARGTTPEEMQARMRADIEKWARGDREGRARKAMTAKVPLKIAVATVGAHRGGQGRNGADRGRRGRTSSRSFRSSRRSAGWCAMSSSTSARWRRPPI